MLAPTVHSPCLPRRVKTTRPVFSHRLIHEEKIKLATNKSKVSQMKKLFQSFSGQMEDSISSPSHGGASAVRSASRAMRSGFAGVLTHVLTRLFRRRETVLARSPGRAGFTSARIRACQPLQDP